MTQPSFQAQSSFALNPKVWLHALIFDGRIAFSWLFFFAFGLGYYALAGGFGRVPLISPPGDYSVPAASAMAGYWGWSLFWGVPGWLSITRSVRRRLFGGHYATGCALWIVLFFAVQLTALVLYPPLGGGLIHFFQRWWFAGTHTILPVMTPAVPPSAPQQVPAAVPQFTPIAAPPAAYGNPATPPPTFVAPPIPQPQAPPAPFGNSIPLRPDIEARLRALDQLLRHGTISQQEFDRQRDMIIRSV